MKKYVAGITLFLCYIIFTPQLLIKNDFIQTVNKAKQASVEITSICNNLTYHGSGIVVNSKGNILTVSHLVPDNACTVVIKPVDNQMYPGRIERVDKENDLALLKINKTFDHYATISSEGAFTGETVFSVSAPENIAGSVTKGIVSNTDIKYPKLQHAYSFDMTVLPGSSGSGIFTEKGKLVSLTASVLSSKEVPNTLTIGIKEDKIKAFLEGANDNNPR